MVDINSANAEQIALLPGIGKAVADKIIEYRNLKGAFASTEELASVPGLSPKKLAGFKGRVVAHNLKVKKIAPSKIPVALEIAAVKPLPPLLELEKSVLKAQGLSHEEESSLLNRSRKAAFLPKLTAFVDGERGDILQEKLSDTTKNAGQKRRGQEIGFGVKLTFDLDRLIYSSEELEIAKFSLKRHELRRDMMAHLHKLYFRYRRLQEHNEPINVAEREELKDTMDSLSAGAFTRLQNAMVSP